MAPKPSGEEVPAGGVFPRSADLTTQQAETTTMASAASSGTAPPTATTPTTTPPGIPSSDEQPTDANFKKLLEQFKAMQEELNKLKQELESKRFLAAQAAEHLKISTPIDLEQADDATVIKPPKPLDRKDVDKPEKYSGNTDLWLRWSKAFRKFLRRQDARWGPLLDTVESQRGRPVTADLEKEWA